MTGVIQNVTCTNKILDSFTSHEWEKSLNGQAEKFITTLLMIHVGEEWGINQRDLQLKTMVN